MTPYIQYSPALRVWCCVGAGAYMCADAPDAALDLWRTETELRATIGALA